MITRKRMPQWYYYLTFRRAARALTGGVNTRRIWWAND